MPIINQIKLSDVYKVSLRSDADYFNPNYVTVYEKLERQSTKTLSFLSDVHGGKRLPKGSHFTSVGIPYIRVMDIGFGFINLDGYATISDKVWNQIRQYDINVFDILVTIVGNTIGLTGMLINDLGVANFTENCARIRNSSISVMYLLAFLLSKFGQTQVNREKVGTSQPKLSLDRLRAFKVALVDDKHILSIENQIKSSIENYRLSFKLYSQAQSLLEKELCLDKIEFSKQRIHTANYNEIVLNNRSDADYYQLKFRQLKAHLSTLNTKTFSQIVTIEKGIEVGSNSYSKVGKLFIRVSNINQKGFTKSGSDKYISTNLFESLRAYSPKFNDILLTKDGSPGICYNVTEEIDGIISGGIIKANIFDTNIPHEYLALVINSKICQMQILRDCSGALILHWKPEQIKQMKIPILDDSLMKELADLVTESKKAKKESEQLLSSAIKQVEDLIESELAKN